MIGASQKLLMGSSKEAIPPAPMELVFDTTLATGTTVTVPLAGTVNVEIDWGDGSVETFTTTGNKTHTYASEGEYTVEIRGTLTGFGANVLRPNLTKCLSFGDLGLTSLASAFRSCVNLTEVPNSVPSSVTNMTSMFQVAAAFNQNIGSWDVSNVAFMGSMFNGASSFNQNIGSWNVANVTTMGSMFNGASAFNNGGSADINGWVTSSVTNMGDMFRNAPFNQNIGSWDVSSVVTISNMFNGASAFNQDISSWNVANVTDMLSMFNSASAFNQNIGSWNVSNVTSMQSMFRNASAFNQNIGSWDVSKVTLMNNMFNGASAMTFPLGSWQTNLSAQPSDFSLNANATFVAFRGTADFPLLADTVTRINT